MELHRLEPKKGGTKRRHGGSISLEEGDLVKLIKYGLSYIGRNL